MKIGRFHLQSTEYRHYRLAVAFSFGLWILVVIFLLIYGKEDSFLRINSINSPRFDFFFRYYTYLGHGIIWVPLILYVLFFRRPFLIAMAASGLFCTVFTQGMKRAFDEMRPAFHLKDQIHKLTDFEIHTNHSFPSGHTSTAFTLALLMAYLYPRNWAIWFFPLVAFFVGYSRIYLSQHFVTDVCAGMFIGILSSWLALLVYERFRWDRPHDQLREPGVSTPSTSA